MMYEVSQTADAQYVANAITCTFRLICSGASTLAGQARAGMHYTCVVSNGAAFTTLSDKGLPCACD